MEEVVMKESPSFKRWGLSQRRLILSEHMELGVSVSSLGRKYGIHPVTIYQWKRSHMENEKLKQSGPSVEELLEQLEKAHKENRHLKKALAEVSVDKSILQDALEIFKKKELRGSSKSQRKSPSKGGTK